MRAITQLFLYFLLCCFLMNCSNSQATKEKHSFTIPHVYNSDFNTTDSIEIDLIEVTQLLATNVGFMGIFKFGDSIDLNVKNDALRNIFIEKKFNDPVTENSQTGLQLIVDYDTDVYRGVPDKLHFCAYPAYLVNTSNTGKMLYGNGGHIFGLQEAMTDATDANSWKPIEMRSTMFYDEADNWQKIIQPQEFALLLFLKYEGTQKTYMRVRIKNGDEILVSNAFEGSINPLQCIPKEGSIEYQIIQEIHQGTAERDYFYGATIPEINPKVTKLINQ
ncbi:MAG: hypothetical protein AAF611_19690 [Bacteroidota bacterium]